MTRAAFLLRQARDRAGLSQRELAQAAGMAASVVGRYERGEVDPSVTSLERLLRAAGFELELVPVAVDPEDLRLIERSLALSLPQRVRANRNASRIAARAHHARSTGAVRRLRGA